MPVKRNQTEAEALEQYRVAFENVEKQPEIANIMAEFGYDETLLTEGKTLLTKTREIYDFNKHEDDEKSAAYKNFTAVKESLSKEYGMHRKKGKVVFRKDEITYNNLSLKGGLPKSYIKWLERIKKFYTVALADNKIIAKLERLKVTKKELNETVKLIAKLETARAEYLLEKGESQDATKIKDKAFEEMDDWMFDFYGVAKIALEDHPQLLESLAKFVRS